MSLYPCPVCGASRLSDESRCTECDHSDETGGDPGAYSPVELEITRVDPKSWAKIQIPFFVVGVVVYWFIADQVWEDWWRELPGWAIRSAVSGLVAVPVGFAIAWVKVAILNAVLHFLGGVRINARLSGRIRRPNQS